MEAVQLITQRSNQNPTTQFNVIESDPSSSFDSENIVSSSFDAEISSEAGGVKRFMKNFRKNQAMRQERRNIRTKSSATARVNKSESKKTLANAQQTAAKAMGNDKSDATIAAALSASSPAKDENKSNTGLYIGIGAGVLLIGGIIAYFIIKKKKK